MCRCTARLSAMSLLHAVAAGKSDGQNAYSRSLHSSGWTNAALHHDIFARRHRSGFDPISGILKIGMQVAHEFAARFKTDGQPNKWNGCTHHYVDVGFNSGSSAYAFFSGQYSFPYCNAKFGNGGKTKTNWVRGLGMITGTRPAMPASLAPLAVPGQFCYHAFEGNPMFTPTLHMLDAFWEGLGGHAAMYPDTLFANEDGFAPMYVDKVADSAWGSSMFSEKTWSCDTAVSCEKAKRGDTPKFTKLNVSTVSASRFIRGLRKSAGPDGKIALKINAEGAEYFIMKDLIAKDVLCEVDYLFVAWHVKQLASQFKSGKLVHPTTWVKQIIADIERKPGCRVQWMIDASCDGGSPYSQSQVEETIRAAGTG